MTRRPGGEIYENVQWMESSIVLHIYDFFAVFFYSSSSLPPPPGNKILVSLKAAPKSVLSILQTIPRGVSLESLFGGTLKKQKLIWFFLKLCGNSSLLLTVERIINITNLINPLFCN